jgi:hypothetical protein
LKKQQSLRPDFHITGSRVDLFMFWFLVSSRV